MRRKLIIIGFTTDYAILDLNSLKSEYEINHVKVPNALRSIFIRMDKIFPNAALYFLNAYYLMCMRSIHADYVLCDDNLISLKLMVLVNKYKYFKKSVVILRNIIKDSSILKLVSDDKFEVYSFDYDDCLKYNLKYYKQYCSGYDLLINSHENTKVKYDFYFLGLDKGRKKILDNLSGIISKYRCLIDVKLRPSTLQKIIGAHKKNKVFEHVCYEEHIKRIISSNVVIDIVQQGQSGLTMRSLEALVAKKKLITNNSNIINERFYNSNNIMIINDGTEINQSELDFFLLKPYCELDNDIISEYSPKSVYREILNNEF